MRFLIPPPASYMVLWVKDGPPRLAQLDAQLPLARAQCAKALLRVAGHGARLPQLGAGRLLSRGDDRGGGNAWDAELAQAFEGLLGARCGGSFWADFMPLSSCRSPQAALKVSYRSDGATRD